MAKPKPHRAAASDGPSAAVGSSDGTPDAEKSGIIVAIGASAGGLQAIDLLLKALPDDTGMSFIILQHLSASHPSLLTEILSKSTPMPTVVAASGMVPQPNHIYVLPPNAELHIANGKLELIPRKKSTGLNLPIDAFMRSLAQEAGGAAIGIVLSGTASDGTLGLSAIKAEGGITFAQRSAEFDAMPRNAINSGHVDFVLSPREIAAQLAQISRHPYLDGGATGRDVPAARLRPILDMLRGETGMDFSHYKASTVRRRTERRMALQSLYTFHEYVTFLRDNPGEIKRLYQDLLIGATRFFRDEKVFRTLRQSIAPRILKGRAPDDIIRVWSLGCSTGEEAYSLAMALFEAMGSQPRVLQIFGTDLNDLALQKARAGLYPFEIARDVSARRLQRFFVKEEHGYRVSKALRDACIFAQHNLFREPPFSHIDLASCRNVLIYMDSELQRQIFPIMHFALKPGGILLLGVSESLGGAPQLFKPLDRVHKIYVKEPAASRPSVELARRRPFTMEPELVENPPGRARTADLDAQQEADRLVLADFAPPGVIVDSALEILQFRGSTSRFLEPAPGAASLHLIKMAKGNLGPALRTAVQEARKKHVPVRQSGLSVAHDTAEIAIEVHPLKSTHAKRPLFLILFQAIPALVLEKPASAKIAGQRQILRLQQAATANAASMRALVEEYEAAREEYQAANEEIASGNEELQSMNEELETSREELQSTNEELNAVNDELRNRNLELHQTNLDLTNLFAAVNLRVVMVDRELRIRRLSPSAEQVFRVIPADIGRRITDIRGNIQVPELDQMIARAIATGEVRGQEVCDSDGRWYVLRVLPYRAEQRIDGAVLALLDIDSFKRANLRAERAAAFADAIVNALRDPLVALDADLRLVRANEAFCQLLGQPREALEGEFLWRIANGQWDNARLRAALARALDGGPSFAAFAAETESRLAAGVVRRSLSLAGLRLPPIEDGQPLLLLAVTDVTDRERAARARLAAERVATANRLATTLAHEINTPLNSVSSGLFLLEEQPLDEAGRRHLRAARLELERVDRLARDLLGFFQTPSRPRQVRCAPLLESALANFLATLADRAIDIRREFAQDLAVEAAPEELSEVFNALLAFSSHSLAHGGLLRLRVAPARDWRDPRRLGVRVTIADNGPGITPEQRRDLLEPAFRTAGRQSGGLRLWISHGVIEKYGGFIQLRSCTKNSRFGPGTCFSVFLPAQPPVAQE